MINFTQLFTLTQEHPPAPAQVGQAVSFKGHVQNLLKNNLQRGAGSIGSAYERFRSMSAPKKVGVAALGALGMAGAAYAIYQLSLRESGSFSSAILGGEDVTVQANEHLSVCLGNATRSEPALYGKISSAAQVSLWRALDSYDTCPIEGKAVAVFWPSVVDRLNVIINKLPWKAVEVSSPDPGSGPAVAEPRPHTLSTLSPNATMVYGPAPAPAARQAAYVPQHKETSKKASSAERTKEKVVEKEYDVFPVSLVYAGAAVIAVLVGGKAVCGGGRRRMRRRHNKVPFKPKLYEKRPVNQVISPSGNQGGRAVGKTPARSVEIEPNIPSSPGKKRGKPKTPTLNRGGKGMIYPLTTPSRKSRFHSAEFEESKSETAKPEPILPEPAKPVVRQDSSSELEPATVGENVVEGEASPPLSRPKQRSLKRALDKDKARALRPGQNHEPENAPVVHEIEPVYPQLFLYGYGLKKSSRRDQIAFKKESGRFGYKDVNEEQLKEVIDCLIDPFSGKYRNKEYENNYLPDCSRHYIEFYFFKDAEESRIFVLGESLIIWQLLKVKDLGESLNTKVNLACIELGEYGFSANEIISRLDSLQVHNDRVVISKEGGRPQQKPLPVETFQDNAAVLRKPALKEHPNEEKCSCVTFQSGRFSFRLMMGDELSSFLDNFTQVEVGDDGLDILPGDLPRCGHRLLNMKFFPEARSTQILVVDGDMLLQQVVESQDDPECEDTYCSRVTLADHGITPSELMDAFYLFRVEGDRLLLDLRVKEEGDSSSLHEPFQSVLLHPEVDAVEAVGPVGGEARTNAEFLEVFGGAFKDAFGGLPAIDFDQDDGKS